MLAHLHHVMVVLQVQGSGARVRASFRCSLHHYRLQCIQTQQKCSCFNHYESQSNEIGYATSHSTKKIRVVKLPLLLLTAPRPCKPDDELDLTVYSRLKHSRTHADVQAQAQLADRLKMNELSGELGVKHSQ